MSNVAGLVLLADTICMYVQSYINGGETPDMGKQDQIHKSAKDSKRGKKEIIIIRKKNEVEKKQIKSFTTPEKDVELLPSLYPSTYQTGIPVHFGFRNKNVLRYRYIYIYICYFFFSGFCICSEERIEVRGRESLWSSIPPETQTALLLIHGDHSSTF